MTTTNRGSGQHQNGQHTAVRQADEQHADGQHADGQEEHQRRAAVSSGNPRITVAFPFSRIDIKEPSEALRDLAAMVEQLAEQVATLAQKVTPDQAESADRLAAQAALLARRLGAAS